MYTLYELTNDYIHLLELAEDPDTDPQVLADTMEGLDGAIEEKADAYAAVIKQLDGQVCVLDDEIARLQGRQMAIEKNIERIENNLKNAMVMTGKTKFKTSKFSFAVQKNGGKLPVKLKVPSAEYLPDAFVRLKREPDMARIRTALDNGTEDVEKYAEYGERGESLRIR